MRRNLRPALALGTTLLAVMLAAQPAAAYTEPVETGHVGEYELNDDETPLRGANCLYETGSFDLDKISIRGPHNVHSSDGLPINQKQKVGWRYIIQRQLPPGTGTWSDYHQSSWVYKLVDGNTHPGQFARRTWTAPEAPTGQFRVLIRIKWVKPGTATKTWGTAKTRYEWYKSKWNGNSYVSQDRCLQDY